jgi:hypothetical protein
LEAPLEVELIRGFIEIEVRDSEGRVVQRGRHEMRSFLNNLLKFLEAFFRGDGAAGVSATDTGGSTRTIEGTHAYGAYGAYEASWMGGAAPAGDDSYGVLVGSGSSPVDLNQYALASKIPHGTGAGQLSYGPTSLDDFGVDYTVSPPVYRFRLVRSFANASSSSVAINEVGFAVRYRLAASEFRFLIARDVLPTSYTVPVGGSAAVAITVEVVLG